MSIREWFSLPRRARELEAELEHMKRVNSRFEAVLRHPRVYKEIEEADP